MTRTPSHPAQGQQQDVDQARRQQQLQPATSLVDILAQPALAAAMCAYLQPSSAYLGLRRSCPAGRVAVDQHCFTKLSMPKLGGMQGSAARLQLDVLRAGVSRRWTHVRSLDLHQMWLAGAQDQELADALVHQAPQLAPSLRHLHLPFNSKLIMQVWL